MTVPVQVTGTVTDGVNVWDVTGTLRPSVPSVAPRPTPMPSFGPNGTHWPADTPWLTDIVPHVIDVACDWPSVAAALATVTQQMADEGCRIRIAPGTLTGTGGGAAGIPVLDHLGDTAWTRKVLVTPRDGYGTVTLTGPTKWRHVHGVTFAGLLGDDTGAVTVQACNGSRLAWSDLAGWLVYGMAEGPGSITEDVHLYEVVVDRPQLMSQDPTGFGSGYANGVPAKADGNGWLRNCSLVGCYTGPHWRIAGDSDHVDTCQMFGGSIYYGFDFVDTALFGSNNCALQTGGVLAAFADLLTPDATYQVSLGHTLLVGPVSAQPRYPVPAGGTALTINQATNGSTSVLPLKAADSLIVGTLYPALWDTVMATSMPASRAGTAARAGGFTVDPTLAAPDAAWFDEQAPRPTPERLAQLWAALT